MRATGYRLGAVPVLELAGGNLFERDLQVVLRPRLDHRRGVLVEWALAQIVVVRVDLAGALGGDENARVMGVDALQQGIQARLDHSCHMVATRSPSSCTARLRSSLTMTLSNSSSAAISSSATWSRRSIWSGASEPRPIRRSRSASRDGGAMKTVYASGTRSRTWRAPCTSISSTSTSTSRSSSERSVP